MQNITFIQHVNQRFQEEDFRSFLQRIWKWCSSNTRVKWEDFRYASLKARKGRYWTTRIQGSRMKLDLADQGICRELGLNGIREDASTYYLKSLLKLGDTVLDVGANIGYYALLESRLVGEEGRVYAVEPVPGNVEALEENIASNGYRNLEVSQGAMGAEPGTAEIGISARCNWHSMQIDSSLEIYDSLSVEVETVDGFLEAKATPGFIRMDVEGFELNVVKGMEQTLKDPALQSLFIEIHPHLMSEQEVDELLQLLECSGFEVSLLAKRAQVFHGTICSLRSDMAFMDGSKGGFQVFFQRV